jgi:probable F420-dependent oxidoreductase
VTDGAAVVAGELSTGVMIPPLATDTPGGRYVALARLAEDLGYRAIYQGDHLFGNTPTTDCMTMLAAFASVTTRVELGTSVVILPLRDPIVFAKQSATLDQLSAGRFRLGIGVGGEIPREFEAMQVPLAGRGRRADAYLALMRQLWSGEPVDHDSGLNSVHGVVGSPLCTRAGGPPIYVGGLSDAAIERAMRYDGWCAYASSTSSMARRVAQIRERRPDLRIIATLFGYVGKTQERAISEAGAVVQRLINGDWRERFGRLSAVGDRDHVGQRLREYAEIGADQVILIPTAEEPEAMADQITLLAEAAGLR